MQPRTTGILGETNPRHGATRDDNIKVLKLWPMMER